MDLPLVLTGRVVTFDEAQPVLDDGAVLGDIAARVDRQPRRADLRLHLGDEAGELHGELDR